MHSIGGFRLFCTGLSLVVTLCMAMAVGTLFLVPDPGNIWINLRSEEMLFSLKLSLVTGSISTLLVMGIALPVGYALSRFEFPFKGLARTVLNLPVAFPELVLGLCLLLLFGNTFVGDLARGMGLEFLFTRQGIVAAQFFTALPYGVRILNSTFDYIDPRLEFVSRFLGHSQRETFFRVSLPLAKNGILAATVITFARCLGAFGTVLILAGGSRMKTEVLPTALFLNISYGNMDMALTSGILLTVVAFAAIYVFERVDTGI